MQIPFPLPLQSATLEEAMAEGRQSATLEEAMAEGRMMCPIAQFMTMILMASGPQLSIAHTAIPPQTLATVRER